MKRNKRANRIDPRQDPWKRENKSSEKENGHVATWEKVKGGNISLRAMKRESIREIKRERKIERWRKSSRETYYVEVST